jgi:hypothetical protein
VSYDLRYAMRPILSGPADAHTAHVHFDDVTCASSARPVDCVVPVSGEPAPGQPDTVQTAAVSGLQPNTIYYFALKWVDDTGTLVGLSNLAGGDNATSGTYGGRTALRVGTSMISVPLRPTPADPASVFGDDVVGALTLFRWDSTGLTSGCYAAVPLASSTCGTEVAIQTITAGQGYLMSTMADTVVIDLPPLPQPVAAGANCGIASSVALRLKLGWNMIGLPFDTGSVSMTDGDVALRLDGTCYSLTQAVAANLMGATVSFLNESGGYTTMSVMDPWQGYYLYFPNDGVADAQAVIELILRKP